MTGRILLAALSLAACYSQCWGRFQCPDQDEWTDPAAKRRHKRWRESSPNITKYRIDIPARSFVVYNDHPPSYPQLMVGGDWYKFNQLRNHPRLKNGGEGAVAFEFGAYIGHVALHLAYLFPKLTIHTFEAMPLCYEYLVENIKANGFEKQIIPHNYAVAPPGQEFVTFYSNVDGTSPRATLAKIQGSREKVFESKVRAITLANALHCFGNDGMIDILHANCEGCEYHFMPIPFNTIGKPIMTGEIHPRLMPDGFPENLGRQGLNSMCSQGRGHVMGCSDWRRGKVKLTTESERRQLKEQGKK